MKNFIRTHNKKFLAVLGVILMIAFILPSQSNLFNPANAGYLVGYVGDKKVYSTDVDRAKNQWEFLEHVIVISPERTGVNQPVFLAEGLRQSPAFNQLTRQIENHPELYYLLQQEADRNGIIVLPSDMDQEFQRRGFAVRLPSGVITALEDITDPQYAAAVRDAGVAFTKVERSLNRAMFAMKISRPLREHEIARQLQQIKLDVVELDANKLLDQVPAPSDEDLKKHFDAFANTLDEAPATPQNPHGFGYKYPNRVTLQYIGVRASDVRNAVLDTKTKHGWDVEAQKYYLRRGSQFQATPATQPTTLGAATLPSVSSTQATTTPTTKPFSEVRDQIVETLMAPEIARRTRELQDRINTRLRGDYDAWQKQNPTLASASTQPSTQSSTQPTTASAPGTGGPSDYASFEYLQKLADDLHQQTGVRPVVAALNRHQTRDDLQAIEGIGTAMLGQPPIPFPLYATQFAEQLVPAAERGKSVVLHPFKPSSVLRNTDGSSYVFRLTDVLASSKPASFKEAAEPVLRDWRLARAYELAMTRARELLEASKSSSLASAAKAANLNSVTTGSFDSTSRAIENLSIPADALNKFRFDALGLLSTAATQPTAPPLRIIEMPTHGRVFVAQLLSATPRMDTVALPMIDAMVENELMNQMSGPIFDTWYDFDQVVARTGWRDANERKGNAG